VGVCIWLANFLRMSRPDQSTRKADPVEVSGRRYSTLTPTSAGNRTSTRRHPASTSNKKSSSSKKNDLFHQRSSRSLLANVLDLEDDFLLLNLAPAAGRMRQRSGHVSTSEELPSSLTTTPISPTAPPEKVDCDWEVDDGLGDVCPPPRPPPSQGIDTVQRGRPNGMPGYVQVDGQAGVAAAWPVDDRHAGA